MTIYNEQVTLFVVEDDDIDFKTIERSFKQSRIANPIVRANDGQQAYDMLLNDAIQRPFVMLLDLQMPRISGLELLQMVRENPDMDDPPIFILTTSSDEKDILTSFKHNVAGYFVKDEVGNEFFDIVSLLQGYWRIAHFSEGPK